MLYLTHKTEGIDENGLLHKYKLKDFKGNNLLIYFYPQDDTPVCTQEALYFKENINILNNYVKVIGVSSSSIEEHKEFQEKYNLNFILISDKENKLKKLFEQHDKYIVNMHRATFILNKNGEIIKYWDKVDVDEHIKEITEYIKANIK